MGKLSHFGPNWPNSPETAKKRLRNGYEKRSKDETEHTQRFVWWSSAAVPGSGPSRCPTMEHHWPSSERPQGTKNAINFQILYPPLVTSLKRPKIAPRGGWMGPTAGSGGLGLIVGVLEGAMGDLVGLRAFPGVAHDDVVHGGWVNHRIFFRY